MDVRTHLVSACTLACSASGHLTTFWTYLSGPIQRFEFLNLLSVKSGFDLLTRGRECHQRPVSQTDSSAGHIDDVEVKPTPRWRMILREQALWPGGRFLPSRTVAAVDQYLAPENREYNEIMPAAHTVVELKSAFTITHSQSVLEDCVSTPALRHSNPSKIQFHRQLAKAR
jgi:hypothetical protein